MVLPQDAVIFLMHADSIFDGAGRAVPVHNVVIEVMDFAETVAT